VRGLALLEGRLVETMLGVRMPRRPPYPPKHMSLFRRIGAMFTDPRSWSSMLYGLLQLPLGIFYFTLMVTLLGVSAGFIAFPAAMLFRPDWLQGIYVNQLVLVDWGYGPHVPGWAEVTTMFVLGMLLLFATLHLARGLGHLHGLLAKHLLVQRARA
jgi:hypothetical protein